jgi:uncharacterized cofD-like protein
LKACFVNLMWQPGETIGFRASDHLQAIARHGGPEIVDVVVVNTKPITPKQRRKYALEQTQAVENDCAELQRLGVEVVCAELLGRGEIVRHDPDRIAAVAMDLARKGALRRQA